MEKAVQNYGISSPPNSLSVPSFDGGRRATFFKRDYLVKEINPSNLVLSEQTLIFQKQKPIPSRDIISLEAISNYTLFYFRNGKKMLVSRTLKEILSNLDPEIFGRVHKSYAINLEYLHAFDLKAEMCVVMKDGKKIEVSRRRKKSFLESVKHYFHNLVVA